MSSIGAISAEKLSRLIGTARLRESDIPADARSLLLALAAAIAIFRFKFGMIPSLAASCIAGVILHALGLLATAGL